MGRHHTHVPIPAKVLCFLMEMGTSRRSVIPHLFSHLLYDPQPEAPQVNSSCGREPSFRGAPWVGFRPTGSLTQSE